jgi:AcrR family transcriptional regulator
MSTNSAARTEKPAKIDSRVRRTRDALGDALIALIQERPFDSITVQDVLTKAKVGRSTFYVHYRDKDDLFMSDVEEFLELAAMALSRKNEKSARVAPVQEFFAHLRDGMKLYKAFVASGKFADFMELARGHFARGIEQRLRQIPRAKSIPAGERKIMSYAVAGTFLSMLTWWLDRGCKESPAVMDEKFHRLVWKGIG